MTSHGPATPSRSSPRSSPSLHWQACSRPGCGSHHGFHGKVAVTAHGSQDSERLLTAGADLVLDPFELAATTTDALDRLVGIADNEQPDG
ncbi:MULTISPECIES: hypothetical protein [unclassified Rhodococcus (in: high G+C Gram-positive bacteria)]|uniref:hypothetical protein n=1 Tax=unclassified Rhodococcus (in: high G+C Gram-positive bacteria) TaxID=192944 RepID=UPI000926FFA0|nr:hypothetical protein [Rhodococcus sp. M8]OLL17429.1 hypothetical protein BKE56_019360 [Rhodococcus sp. M8]QPG45700.1 hypothetical protein ISO16_00955 [Rhodococcus sp. M8]